MKKNIYVLATSAILLLTVSSCKKYEYGSAMSKASIKGRVVNTWEAESVTDANGQDISDHYVNTYSIEFKKDNTFIEKNSSNTIAGTWDFDEDKNNILTFPTSNNYNIDTYLILKLKKNEFWVRRVSGSPSGEEIHFVSK
jgi:hypothetical protein